MVSQVFKHSFPHSAVIEPYTGGIVLLSVLEGEVIIHQRIVETIAAHSVRKSVEVGNPDLVFYVGDTEHTPAGECAADIGRTVHLHGPERCISFLVTDIGPVDIQDKIDPGMDFDRFIYGLLQNFSVDILVKLDILRITGIQEVKIQPGTVADRSLCRHGLRIRMFYLF